ncbi:hypothetical protein K1719_013763 [Acacia pycnantha]|nr:hypothetical protein K1719_013763 [Acacia pycnantha]
MVKKDYKRLKGYETFPGLLKHEVSFLRLLEKICDGCYVEINEAATKLKYKPGIVMGGKNLAHDCGVSRSIESRGVPPEGGGEVVLSVPIVQSLTAVSWTDEGMVKRIRGVTFSARVSSQFEHSMIHAARGIFNRLLPDVHIFTDHKAGPQAGKSPGYGISLVAETTSGCFISVNTAVSRDHAEETSDFTDDEKKGLIPPEDVGQQTAYALLQEIQQGGVVDSTHQGLLFLLCALCPQDVSKIRVGQLSQHGIETLRNISEFLDLKFVIKPDPKTHTVILECIGSGLKNLSRKLS